MKNISKNKKFGKKNKSIFKKHISGFTLVELLAALAVLSIVLTIVIYLALNIINNSKQKSYQVTINNIQASAGDYLIEDIASNMWVDGDLGNYQYQCVTVQNLIDAGYFKSDVLDSMVSDDAYVKADDAVYVERDKTSKSITKSILLVSSASGYSGLCDGINTSGKITFDVSPSGWAKEKTINIRYKLYNFDDITEYKYSYKYVLNDLSINKTLSEKFSNSLEKEQLIINENGMMYAIIADDENNSLANKTLVIDKIDNIAPSISADAESNIVRGKVTIPLVVNDNESGLSEDELKLSELVVYIGSNKLTSGVVLEKVDKNNYNLEIENYHYAGKVIIKVYENSLFDKVGNGNVEKDIETLVNFTNTYTIEYKGNGGTWNNTDTWSNTATYGKNYEIEENFYTRTGYTFIGWSTKSDNTDDGYNWTNWSGEWKYTDGQYGISNGKLTLYARWVDSEPPTPPIIKLNASGDIIFSGSTDNVTASDKIVYKGSTTNSNYVSNFTISSSSDVYAIAVDEEGNESDSSHKEYIVKGAESGTVKYEEIITGYKCSVDNEIYETEEEAEGACTDTVDAESSTSYYCKDGYTYNSSTNKCDKTGTVTEYYYCSNTKKYQTSIACDTKYNQGSCSSGWSATENGKCSFSCGASIAEVYSYCSGTTSCTGGTRSCVSTCSGANDNENCRAGVTLSGDRCTALSKLYTCTLYGTKYYYCSLTGKYTATSPTCSETISLSSSTTYSCPEGYTSSDKKITSSSKCSKTETGEVTAIEKEYYSCSLFSDKEYSTETTAKAACTNYCSNSSTKYYSGKNKCIGLSD